MLLELVSIKASQKQKSLIMTESERIVYEILRELVRSICPDEVEPVEQPTNSSEDQKLKKHNLAPYLLDSKSEKPKALLVLAVERKVY